MWCSVWFAGIVAVAVPILLGGCTPSAADSLSDEAIEKSVRQCVAAQFQVDGQSIEMDMSISTPPLNADDVDLVEIIMELEDRLGVSISDEAVDRANGGTLGTGQVRVTPQQLVDLVKSSPQARKANSKP